MSDYDIDFYAWTQTQATALRAREWKTLDIDNLAEEIESLGRSDRRAITHQLERVLIHLLKWAYQPHQRTRYGRSWRRSIYQARHAIADLIDESPSLRDYPAQHVGRAYRRARQHAEIETSLPLATFPEACPWPIEQVLDEDFWPPDAPAREDEDEEIPLGPRWGHGASREPPEERRPGQRRGPRRT
jgi:hypothetical protein